MTKTLESITFSKFGTLNDRNGIRTHNHLVRKQTLNYLAKLTSCKVVCSNPIAVT